MDISKTLKPENQERQSTQTFDKGDEVNNDKVSFARSINVLQEEVSPVGFVGFGREALTFLYAPKQSLRSLEAHS